ncbi:hypothetical protein H2201_003003 [Coniosporium apollinis]|uniref:MARVEL domain-containing protein n=1 Tax=Coniosporium apollinis TaxID=61459 RepID=A0ABQ9NWV4_9PEZI|nr:hypothetical protein H2201_003003 [Coniosporium apollinis]
MATAEVRNGFNTRAAALLAPVPPPEKTDLALSRPLPSASAISSGQTTNEKQSDSSPPRASPSASATHTKSFSLSSNTNTLASSPSNGAAESKHGRVRTIPPWVQSVQEDDGDLDPTKRLLPPRTPANAQPASHYYMPAPKPNAVAGRRYDHVRESTPVTIRAPISERASRWRQFAKSTAYGWPSLGPVEIVDDEWMRENLRDLEAPWQADASNKDPEKDPGFWLFKPAKRKARFQRAHRTLMRNPVIPLVFRMIVLAFSALALGLSSTIFHKANINGCSRGGSTWLAVIVDVVAIVYICYITYDEYTSKPLGLRSPGAKMRLIFLDLFFIVFDSANLSLAFGALTDEQWACRDGIMVDEGVPYSTCPFNNEICTRQKALTATLLVALVAWLATFAVSTLR